MREIHKSSEIEISTHILLQLQRAALLRLLNEDEKLNFLSHGKNNIGYLIFCILFVVVGHVINFLNVPLQ